MGEPTPAGDLIVVPPAPPLWGAGGAPISVELPLVCRPRRGLMSAYGALLALLAAAFALSFLAVLHAPEAFSALKLLLLAVLGFSTLYAGALGLTALRDAVHQGPSVVIDATGFEDRRQKKRVAWNEILQAEIRPSRIGIAHLAVRTREGRVTRGAPFRVGAYRRRGDQIVVPLQFLTPPPHVSAFVMVSLVERAGGVVLRKPPAWARS